MKTWPGVVLPPLEPSITLPDLRIFDSRLITQVSVSGQGPFTMYVCGITPYDATHLGHAATYLTFDLIHRYLVAQGRLVEFVENVTDIDEPLLERAIRDHLDWRDLAHSQVDLFRADMTALRILPPKDFVAATAAMDLVNHCLLAMSRNGFTYKVENDLYFDISPFLDRLPLPIDEAIALFAERGGDPQRIGKRHPLDPVLWWAHKNDEPGWDSDFGFGRPGWHIECAAIALTFLRGFDPSPDHPGYCIDLQGGGSDLIFPHHFMSAAQVSAITGREFARYTVHSGMVGLDGEKMSKSKGNLVFVSTLLQEGVDPVYIRYALLLNHYAADRMWTHQLLDRAIAEVNTIRQAMAREEVAHTQSVIRAIISALSNNLDTPEALRVVLEWAFATLDVDESTTRNGNAGELSRATDSLLGLAF